MTCAQKGKQTNQTFVGEESGRFDMSTLTKILSQKRKD